MYSVQISSSTTVKEIDNLVKINLDNDFKYSHNLAIFNSNIFFVNN